MSEQNINPEIIDPSKLERNKIKNAIEEAKFSRDWELEEELYKIFDYVHVMDIRREDLIPSRCEVAGKIGYSFLHFDEWWTKGKSRLQKMTLY